MILNTLLAVLVIFFIGGTISHMTGHTELHEKFVYLTALATAVLVGYVLGTAITSVFKVIVWN